METQNWNHRIAKLALAFAIIRSKPEQKSSRGYTEHLAKLVSTQDVNWKEKVLELEAKVLQLRQQLFLAKMNAKCLGKDSEEEKGRSTLIAGVDLTPPSAQVIKDMVIFDDDGDDDNDLDLDYELLFSLCSTTIITTIMNTCLTSTREHSEDLGATRQLPEDNSGFESYNESMMDISTVCHCPNDSEQPYATPSYLTSSNLFSIVKHCPVSEKQLFEQIHFLNYLLAIRKLTTTGGFLRDLTKLAHECSVIADSLTGLFNGLLSLYYKAMPSIWIFQTEAIGTVTRFFTDSQLPENLLEKCIKNVEEFEKALCQQILSDNETNRFQLQQSMGNCLTLLGKCQTLRGPLINLLLGIIKNCVDELLFHHQNQTGYDIVQYENIFSLCLVLETLLQYIKEEHETLVTQLLKEDAKLFIQRLDQTILYLSDEFPLFSLYLWRLGTLCSYITK
ncbi:meiosis-specific protein MEI4 [Spea bombifrons]|uniref:meiosis-specific protein MEI4 n=1 Tax=Spea bombifrons TaxID=233779 RepID=UPI00234BBF51|nr:meiosis-specific protein MEI4 [Spea bombifrons]